MSAVGALRALRAASAASARRRLVAAALALLLAACTPLYLPPVPSDALAPVPSFRLRGASVLEVVAAADGEATLRLTLTADEVPEGGWLALQWFGPSGAARASDSLWFEPEDVGRARRWDAPPQLRLEPGEWRAVLSWRGRVVRQLRVDVP